MNMKHILANYLLRFEILVSSENTMTNGVNMHGFCTDTFLNWIKVNNLSYSIGRKHDFCLKISKNSVREN